MQTLSAGEEQVPTKAEIANEDYKMRYLRTVVDLTTAILRYGNISMPEALQLLKATKKHVLNIFPDKEETYDLIYTPRCKRIIHERLNWN